MADVLLPLNDDTAREEWRRALARQGRALDDRPRVPMQPDPPAPATPAAPAVVCAGCLEHQRRRRRFWIMTVGGLHLMLLAMPYFARLHTLHHVADKLNAAPQPSCGVAKATVNWFSLEVEPGPGQYSQVGSRLDAGERSLVGRPPYYFTSCTATVAD